jgi:hypothetical protein
MWTLMPQSQHCGAQLHARGRPADGSAPAEAVKDRAAQDHEQAGLDAPGRPPAARLEDGEGDNTPTAPRPEEVNAVDVQGAAGDTGDDLPLPEGK